MSRKFLYIYLSFIIGILITGFYFHKLILELPAPESLLEYTPTLSTKIYDINNELITELYTEKRTWVPLNRIPVDLQNAVIAIEDHKFFQHWGISYSGIIRATLVNLLKRKFVAGGSTITQQLAKLAFLTQEKTFSRKIKELMLAFELERNFSKQEILEIYLNQVYFGHGAYGVEQAARVYFKKHVYELNLSECAMIAGLLRYPHYYSPIKNPRRAIFRRQVVLSRMRELGYISIQEELSACAEPIYYIKEQIPVSNAGYFVEYLRLTLESQFGIDSVYRSGLNIWTTLDVKMQSIAEQVAEKMLSDFDMKRKQEEIYKNKLSTFNAEVQVALLAMDTKTGGIRVMVGGRDFKKSQFNRVIQARRQPGSAFKPFIYVTAIERGYTPATLIEDTPVVYLNDGHDWKLVAKTTDYLLNLEPEIVNDPMKVWVPENYKKKYHGEVLLRKALELSLNVCAVRVAENVGIQSVIETARKMGISSPMAKTFSLALGASDMTLYELVRAYNVFANRGIKVEPNSIIRIEDRNGRLLQDYYPQEEEVLTEQVAYIMTKLLEGVVKEGTAVYANYLKRPCAGKTGTTNEFTDAWFIGYTPEMICGVWVGYDDRTTLGDKKTGGAVACPIWTHFMLEALKDKPVLEFPVPSKGIVNVMIDVRTGLLASNTNFARNEVFIAGTEPLKFSPFVSATDYFSLPVEENEQETGF